MFNKDFKVTSTFESTFADHEDCPARKVHWNDHEGQCDVHDEWFQNPEGLVPNAGFNN